MNTLEVNASIVVAALLAMAIMVLIYDQYKYRKYYSRKPKLVILRVNNSYVRGIIANSGINVCTCAYNEANRYLYATDDGERVCGFSEHSTHMIADAAKRRQPIIDCGIDIKRFIYEVEKLQQEYGADKP